MEENEDFFSLLSKRLLHANSLLVEIIDLSQNYLIFLTPEGLLIPYRIHVVELTKY